MNDLPLGTLHGLHMNTPIPHDTLTLINVVIDTLLPSYHNSQVQEGDATSGISPGITVSNGGNDSIVLPATALRTFTATPEILQQSSDSSLPAILSFDGILGGGVGLGADGGNVIVETTVPVVDAEKGVEVSGDGNGTYSNGDTVFITVW